MHKGNPTSAACMFLLFLIHTPVSPECRSGTADECQTAQFVPGYNLAGAGFDITTMKMAQGKIVDVDQWKNTDGTCTLCRNPWLPGEPFQKLPLAATVWDAVSNCSHHVRAAVEHSVISVATMQETMVEQTWSAGLNLSVPKSDFTVGTVLVGSHSEIVKFSRRQSLIDKNVFLHHENVCTYYRLLIKKNAIVTEHFREKVKELPAQYDHNSKAEYFHLIRTYGTHIINEVDLGGRIRFLMSMYLCEISVNDLTAHEILSCLSVQLLLAIGTVDLNLHDSFDSRVCKHVETQKQFHSKFHMMRKHQHEEIVGGNMNLRLFGANSINVYSGWVESVKYHPGIVHSVLLPIHTLVAEQDPQREGLQKAVTDYIEGRSLTISCTNYCPAGNSPRADQDCFCSCSENGITNHLCCSKAKRMGKLTVWIDSAHGLWGDYFTETDAYVLVEFQGHHRETSIVWNNNHPVYNVIFDLGTIYLLPHANILTIRVNDWDPWPRHSEELGACLVVVGAGRVQHKICNLKHGYLRYRYQVVCGPHLGGSECNNYVTERPTYSSILYAVKQEGPY